MERTDPLTNFNFLVEIEGLAVGGFAEVSGLTSTTETVEYREGGENTTVRKLPGKTSFADIVLRKGSTGGDNTLYEWHREIVDGTITRKSGSVIVLDRAGEEALRYNFYEAWPTEFSPSDFNATSSEVANESVTLAIERLEIG